MPTWEIFPPASQASVPINSTFLEATMPANLYPLTWLLPNGLLFVSGAVQVTPPAGS